MLDLQQDETGSHEQMVVKDRSWENIKKENKLQASSTIHPTVHIESAAMSVDLGMVNKRHSWRESLWLNPLVLETRL